LTRQKRLVSVRRRMLKTPQLMAVLKETIYKPLPSLVEKWEIERNNWRTH